MSDSIIDLDTLAAPIVVEELSFETIFRSKLDRLLALDTSFSALLESDPAIKLIEANSYDELILRQRINDAARARLLAFATKSDLEQLAAFYGVTRLTGESDTSLKNRTREAIMGRSAAGTAAQYRFAALSASTDVVGVQVDSPKGGVVRVSILSGIGDGTPTPELLATVTSVVASDSVRALNDTLMVVGAEIVPVDITANVYLTRNAPEAVFTGLSNLLRAEFLKVRSLGYNVAPSWITSKLQTGGVQRIDLSAPASQIAIGPTQCASIRNINLTLAGRDY